MGTKVTVVMYHYVRNLAKSRFPDIKGLDTQLFKQQLGYLQKHYSFVKMEDVVDAISGGKELPDNAVLLTFDDGYSDHYTTVFPILDELGVQGSFFAPVKTIQEHQVLDVNKIHFVLAAVKEKKQLVDRILAACEENKNAFGLRPKEEYYKELAKPNRFDTGDVIFIKRMLQRELPEELRAKIVDELFREFVSADEEAFSRELYMNEDQLKCMVRHGMFIGSHGFDHYWLNTLDKKDQQFEVEMSLKFLSRIGCDVSKFAICYPYGAWNDGLLEVLEKLGCGVGFVSEIGIADVKNDNKFLLPRLDTNDIPKDQQAAPNEWTKKIL